MADIFLSYAREDEARAAVVARVLGELGWSVFWDRRIIAGTSWDEVVERELQACRCVVVLWSAASIASRWVKTEARFALQRSTLVPANLDRSEPPLEFRFLESAQLHTWQGATDDSEFSVLSEGIAQHVKPVRRESNVEPTATPTAAPKRERAPRFRRRPLMLLSSTRRRASAVRKSGPMVATIAQELGPAAVVAVALAPAVDSDCFGCGRPGRDCGHLLASAHGPSGLQHSGIDSGRLENNSDRSSSSRAGPRPSNPIATTAPPPQATSTGRSRSGGDGKAKSPPRTDVKTEALLQSRPGHHHRQRRRRPGPCRSARPSGSVPTCGACPMNRSWALSKFQRASSRWAATSDRIRARKTTSCHSTRSICLGITSVATR